MKRLLFSFIIICIIVKILALSGCANIIPPTGGPRDSLPPVLLKAAPDNYAVKFTGNRITLTFDEYLEVKDPRENVIVSPTPKQDPTIEGKLKTITIKIKDTLQPNTTYSFNFGNAVRDINEGNILKNFTYVFSTGPHIDSMMFSGKVIIASTGKADSTLIAMLYNKTDDDSTVAKQKPRYIARIDSSGNFTFHYLQAGVYNIYALKDESGQKKYLSKAQLFAFADSPVVVQENYAPVTLYAYADTAGQKPVKKSTGGTGGVKLPATKKTEKEKRLIVQANIPNGLLDLLDSFKLQFPVPLKSFDSAKVRFTDDKFNDITSYYYIKDSALTKIYLMYKWPMDTKYHLILDKEFAEDTLGNKLLKTDTINFQTKKESDYGALRLRFPNIDLSKNPVLEFVQGDAIKLSHPFGSSKIYTNKLFLPGEYELRILYDDNKNGVWDPGEFFGKHKQPEKVMTLKKKLTVKQNWDNDVDINL